MSSGHEMSSQKRHLLPEVGGKHNPSENEFDVARFLGKHIAAIATKIFS